MAAVSGCCIAPSVATVISMTGTAAVKHQRALWEMREIATSEAAEAHSCVFVTAPMARAVYRTTAPRTAPRSLDGFRSGGQAPHGGSVWGGAPTVQEGPAEANCRNLQRIRAWPNRCSS